ncbi:MAG: flagellar motor switch protein FliG [Loktanella sp.]|nr:flagellar motor switch protein FliG [Loktanella sp.]
MQSVTAVSSPSQPAAPPLELSNSRKAALIVQLLISDGGRLPLSSLPDAVQERLAQELGAITLVDRQTVESVASEFADLLDAIGLSAPGGANAAIDALSAHLSPHLADRLRQRVDQPDGRDPWAVLADREPEDLATILSSESTFVAAITVSKLPVALAAKALSICPGPLARRITQVMSRTTDTAPETVRQIGMSLVTDYCVSLPTAFAKPAPVRVGSILNASPAALRDDLLADLDQADQAFARDVRKAIFTFADIPARLAPADIPAALRVVPGDVMTRALAHAQTDPKTAATAEFIFANLSQRMGGQIKDDIAESGPPSAELGETAMNEVTAAIRDLADAGTISLKDPEDSG